MQLPAVDLMADAEHVSIRMTDMHLPDAPGLIGGWMRDFQFFGEASLMYLVDVIDPDRHPGALVCSLVGPWAGLDVLAAAPTALPGAAQEDVIAVAARSRHQTFSLDLPRPGY